MRTLLCALATSAALATVCRGQETQDREPDWRRVVVRSGDHVSPGDLLAVWTTDVSSVTTRRLAAVIDADLHLPRAAVDGIAEATPELKLPPTSEVVIAIVKATERAAAQLQLWHVPPDLRMIKILAGDDSAVILIGSRATVTPLAALGVATTGAGPACEFWFVPAAELARLTRAHARARGDHRVIGATAEEWLRAPPRDHPAVALRFVEVEDGAYVVVSLWAALPERR